MSISDPVSPEPERVDSGAELEVAPEPPVKEDRQPWLVLIGASLLLDLGGLYLHGRNAMVGPPGGLFFLLGLVAVGSVVVLTIHAYQGKRRWGPLTAWAWAVTVGLGLSWLPSLVMIINHQTRGPW